MKRLRVFVLSHEPARLENIPKHPHLRPVDLATLSIGKFQTNALAENRAFLFDWDLSDVDYVGFVTARWNEKYPSLISLEELKDLELTPDTIWCPNPADRGWLEYSEKAHPGMEQCFRDLEGYTKESIDHANGRASVWSNSFICHKKVAQEFFAFWRTHFFNFYERYGGLAPFLAGDTVYRDSHASRSLGFWGERITMWFFATRMGLTIQQVPFSNVSSGRGPRLLICEENVTTRGMHFHQFTKLLADYCREKGDDVQIAVNKWASFDVLNDLKAIAIFPWKGWHAPVVARVPFWFLPKVILRNWRNYRAIVRYLKQQKPFDCLFISSAALESSLVWFAIALQAKRFGFRRFVIQMRSYFSDQTNRPFSLSEFCFKGLLRLFRTLVKRGEVIFATDSHRLVEYYKTQHGLETRLFPIPTLSEPPPVRDTRPKEFRLLCHAWPYLQDRGTDLVYAALYRILVKDSGVRLKVLLRSFPQGSGPELEFLRNDPRVSWIPPELTPWNEYCQHLREASFAVLAYRIQDFKLRLSGSCVDAIMAGLPIVTARDTWLADTVEEYGSGVTFEDGNVEELVSAIFRLIENYEAHCIKAREGVQKASQFFSAENLRRLALGLEADSITTESSFNDATSRVSTA